MEGVERIAHPEPEIGGHLVVARPRGVQPTRNVANQLLEPGFDIHVNVFELGAERERPGVDFRFDRIKPLNDGRAVGRCDDLGGHQHAAMGSRGRKVLLVKPPIDIDRRVDLFHDCRRARRKATTPKGVRGVVLIFG